MLFTHKEGTTPPIPRDHQETSRQLFIDLFHNSNNNNNTMKEMPLLTITSPETIQKCRNLKLKPSDIFICSYPKSGTTWTQHIIISLLLLHRRLSSSSSSGGGGDKDDIEYNHVSEYAPFFEIDPHWKQQQQEDAMIDSIQEKHALLGRRVFNTHLRGDMLPQKQQSSSSSATTTSAAAAADAKFIYVLRSPLDVCVSFYHHLSHQVEGCYEKPFNDFFNEWMQGDIPFGTWMDHVLSYAPYVNYTGIINSDKTTTKPASKETDDNNNKRNILLITYEEMVLDLKSTIHKIVTYLELNDLITLKEIDTILETFTFANMKQNLDKFQPKSVTWKNDFKFLRKGTIGDGTKTIVSKDQMHSFRQKIHEMEFDLQLTTKCKNRETNEMISSTHNRM